MRRNILPGIIAAALLPAGSLWAAPHANAAAQYLNQINEQTYQIQADAGLLEQYVRSGAVDWTINAGVTVDVAEGAQKLLRLLDQVAAQPGATNDTRLQMEKIRSLTSEVLAFDDNALSELEPRALALNARNVMVNATHMQELCNTIRGTVQSLLAAR
jgi:hypothetical protein